MRWPNRTQGAQYPPTVPGIAQEVAARNIDHFTAWEILSCKLIDPRLDHQHESEAVLPQPSDQSAAIRAPKHVITDESDMDDGGDT